ncbi:MAG: hypothetical protein AAF656_12705, partial [Planctomycetota bacterium]
MIFMNRGQCLHFKQSVAAIRPKTQRPIALGFAGNALRVFINAVNCFTQTAHGRDQLQPADQFPRCHQSQGTQDRWPTCR